MSEPRLPALTLDGWYVLHQFFRLDWGAFKRLDPGERRDREEEMAAFLEDRSDLGDEGWSGGYWIVGGDADVLLMHFRPTLEDLADAEWQVALTGLGDYLTPSYDYLSVVELGQYSLTLELVKQLEEEGVERHSDEWNRRMDEALEGAAENSYVQHRLEPRQPDDMPYVSFYPMDKRREPEQNWYRLSLEEREELMAEHGRIGRRYAGRVSQVISGSVGFDDWEWGVTLFSDDPLEFKTLVTEMRYDEASATYAEFGPFFAGKRMGADDWIGLAEG